jgi:hypothetical protein
VHGGVVILLQPGIGSFTLFEVSLEPLIFLLGICKATELKKSYSNISKMEDRDESQHEDRSPNLPIKPPRSSLRLPSGQQGP